MHLFGLFDPFFLFKHVRVNLGSQPNHDQTKPSLLWCFLSRFWPFFGQKYQKVNGFDLRTHIPWQRTLSGIKKYLSHPLGNSKNIILVRQTCAQLVSNQITFCIADEHRVINKLRMTVREFFRTAILVACGFFLGCLFNPYIIFHSGKNTKFKLPSLKS